MLKVQKDHNGFGWKGYLESGWVETIKISLLVGGAVYKWDPETGIFPPLSIMSEDNAVMPLAAKRGCFKGWFAFRICSAQLVILNNDSDNAYLFISRLKRNRSAW